MQIRETFIIEFIERDKFHMSINKKGNFAEQGQLQTARWKSINKFARISLANMIDVIGDKSR